MAAGSSVVTSSEVWDAETAARYDAEVPDMFAPEVVGPAVERLAELAGKPSELDLMARIAGMRLEGRYADWHRASFTDESTSHVSVWRR